MAKILWAVIVWGQIYPIFAHADPLIEAGQEIQSELRFKKSGIPANGSNELSWEQVKPLIISSWLELIEHLGITKPHAQFLATHHVTIRFAPLGQKLGTYDRRLRQVQFNDWIFEQLWTEIKTQGLGGEAATHELASYVPPFWLQCRPTHLTPPQPNVFQFNA